MVILSSFEFVEGRKVDSASPTDMWKIRNKITKKEYMIKLFVYSIGYTDKRVEKNTSSTVALLEHEIRVYCTFKKYLIKEKNIRNILPYNTTKIVKFHDLFDFVLNNTQLKSKELLHNFIQNTKYMLNLSGYSDNREKIDSAPNSWFLETNLPEPYDIYKFKYALCITNFIGGIQSSKKPTTLTDAISYHRWDVSSLSKILCVLFTTIYKMALLGFNQNDLHWSNIFVTDKYFGPTKWHLPNYLLVFNNKTYMITSKYTPVIFDFDRASMFGNYMKILEGGKKGGNCPEYHLKRDFLRTLCNLYRHIDEELKSEDMNIFKKEILEFIDDDKLRYTIKNPPSDERACWLTKDDTSYQCITYYLNSVAEPEKILSFLFQKSEYKYVHTDNVLNNNNNTLSMIKNSLDLEPHVNLKNTSELEKFITANVQFVGYFKENEKKKFIKNILKSFSN